MKRKAAFLMVAIAVVLAVLLVGTVTRAKSPFISNQTLGWELTGMSTVSPGQVVKMEEGIFVQGIVVEAQARARSGNSVSQGTFRLTYDIFTPNRDMPGQKAGINYVVGEWTITRHGAPVDSTAARHSPDVIRGRILTELAFNPAADNQSWTAPATLPMSPAAGRWSRGQGSFSFDARGTGRLTLDASLWPAAEPAQ